MQINCHWIEEISLTNIFYHVAVPEPDPKSSRFSGLKLGSRLLNYGG